MDLSVLKKSFLFEGIKDREFPDLLRRLSATDKRYVKGSPVFKANEKQKDIGIVLSGTVHVFEEDYWGNRALIARMGPGDSFGEAFACLETPSMSVSVLSANDSEILFVKYRKIIDAGHPALLSNMIRALAERTVMLRRKIGYLSKRTIREKLMAYLSGEVMDSGGNSFEVPFNRQELADYLAVDRSAMTRELSKMRAEGLISFARNTFTLIE